MTVLGTLPPTDSAAADNLLCAATTQSLCRTTPQQLSSVTLCLTASYPYDLTSCSGQGNCDPGKVILPPGPVPSEECSSYYTTKATPSGSPRQART